jgi:hypothetical protein
MLLHSLVRYYNEPEIHKIFTEMINGDGPVSLRLMEWFVTNYAKKQNVYYHTHTMRCFNVYLSYKAQLRAYNKRYFDPFCRNERVCITDQEGNTTETTVGQANFFRWVIQNDVLQWATTHIADIESDMVLAARERDENDTGERSRTGRRKRRGEISQSATRKMNRTHEEITISFK